jgi:F-type H+-transporting ATPase subunit delta
MAAAAERYARAVFELASAEDEVDKWGDRLRLIAQVLSVPEVRGLFANPTISREQLEEAVDALKLPRLGAEGVNLLKLLVEGRRVELAEEIARGYERLADAAAGRVRATVTTAVELSKGDRDGLRDELSKSLGKDVRLEARVDPAILGGLVLQVGDELTDVSVAGRLQQLRRQVIAS